MPPRCHPSSLKSQPPPVCRWPSGHKVRQAWTVPVFFSPLASRPLSTCLAAHGSVICELTAHVGVLKWLQTWLVRERAGGWGGRRYADRESEFPPRKPQKCPRPQKEWNQFKKPCAQVPPPPRLPPLRPRSLLPAQRPSHRPQPSHWWRRFWRHPPAEETFAI